MIEWIKKEWIARLRSGEYQKGEEYLSANGRFCCLGVLCELAIDNGLEVEVVSSEVGVTAYDNAVQVPPLSVLEWAGIDITTPNPPVYYQGRPTFLATLNDGNIITPKLDFNQIADVIEQQL